MSSTRSAPANAGAKKLTIKVKSKPGLPPNYFESTWKALENALRAVRERRPADHGFQELYSMVEDLCLHRFGGDTYVRLFKDVDAYLARAIKQAWEANSHLEARHFLETFATMWSEYAEQMKAVRLIFTVLDRSPKCMMQTEVPPSRSLWDMGLLLFKTHLEKTSDCLNKLVSSVLEVVADERRMGGSETLIFTAHHDILRMFSNLSLYDTYFEPEFLNATTAYYTREASENMQTLVVADYLVVVEKRWAEESLRGVTYLDVTTRKPLRKIVEQTLLINQASILLEKGLDQLLEDETRLADLARMFRLFSAVGLQAMLVKGFSVYLRAKGMNLVMDDENQDLIGSLLQFKSKVDRMLKEAFAGDEAFIKANRDAFEHFLNSRDNKPAELVAKYCDRALRSTATSDSYSLLQRTMELFRFLHAKDVFEEFYKQALAKRLLLGTSSSNELEKMMISTLKAECGSSFTNKLEGMFRDMDLGRTLQIEYSRSQQSSPISSSPDTAVQVLSMGFWPTFPDSTVRLPPQLATEQERFKQFYSAKHQGRVLHWVNSLSHCIVKAWLPKGKWDLEVSLFQALVLLQFNDGSSRQTFRTLGELTGIANDELARTLTSLALGKKDQRVLVRVEKGSTPVFGISSSGTKDKDDESDDEEVAPSVPATGSDPQQSRGSKLPNLEDVYEVNTLWTSKKLRLKINQVQIKETKKENDEAHKRVQNDRQYQVDAAIVRIMKSRKQLTHNLLVTELFKQLPFPAKPQDLKKRIESLIEREYLERDDADPNQYLYVA